MTALNLIQVHRGPLHAAELDDKGELAERELFIREAMREHSERVREAVEEMGKKGVAPYLRVAYLVPFADWDFYYVKGGSILWGRSNQEILKIEVEVPEGFVTDLASIPRIFWRVLRPEGRHAFAAVVHDYLYWMQTKTREESDQIFKEALQDSKVNSTIVELMYQAVRRFGQSAW